jgi:hypothetical protein
MPPPYVTNPPDTSTHTSSATSAITWTMGTIAHYSSKVIIGTQPGWSDAYPGREIVNSAQAVTDSPVSTPGGGIPLYTKIQYKRTRTDIWRNGGTITSFTCN